MRHSSPLTTRLQGGTLVTPEGLLKADLDFSEGQITGVYPADEGPSQSPGEITPDRIIPVKNQWILPGAVDAHTHFGMPLSSGISSLGWRESSEAALLGGTTTIVDFANQSPGQALTDAVDTWRKAAAHSCLCDYGLHITVVDTDPEFLAEIPDLVAAGLPTFKGFLAYKNRLMLEPRRMRELMVAVQKAGGLLLVHAEDGEMNHQAQRILQDTGRIGPRWHPLAHPPQSEVRAVTEAAAMALATNCPLLLVHLSLAASLDALLNARTRRDHQEMKTPLFGEVCLHHLLASEELYEGGHDAALGAICSPPLRDKKNQPLLKQGLTKGSLDILSTDHCEFSLKVKAAAAGGGFYKVPNGCGGVGERLILSHTHLVVPGLMTPQRWVEVICEAPARLMGLGHCKGRLVPGLDADLVVFDPTVKHRWLPLGPSDQAGSLWKGMPAVGAVRDVWLRGNQVVAQGRLVSEPPVGHFQPRELPRKGT